MSELEKKEETSPVPAHHSSPIAREDSASVLEKHSPLPWKRHVTKFEAELIDDANGRIICRAPNNPENGKLWHLDAPLIVRSVNALPELVKALEEIAATKNNGPDWSMARKCQRIAIAALAKVKESSR